jgi:flagellar biosynthesis anti-sigma factor FlgM
MMKITHNKVGQNLSLKDTQKGIDAQKADSLKALNKDQNKDLNVGLAGENLGAVSLNISQRAAEAQKIKSLINQVPDVDEAKIAKFQKLIDSGEYTVDSKKLADKMLEEQMSWE